MAWGYLSLWRVHAEIERTLSSSCRAGVLTLQLSDAARVERECLIDKLKSLLSKR